MASLAETPRKIIHVDMDAFYASVEQRDNPTLKGLPVVVGGSPHSRGVVCAASYEARKFGIRSAMPCSEAYRRCHHAVFVSPRFDIYKSVSNQIMEIFRQYTDLVEALSLDEAYLDVTENKKAIPYASEIAKQIRVDIFEKTGLTASAGVAPNKFLAKIASDMQKPNGLVVITPKKVPVVLEALPVKKLPGIGKVTEEKMNRVGIFTTQDIRNCSKEKLLELFGKNGEWYHQIAHGLDGRAVNSDRERKSVGAEDTFGEDILDHYTLHEKLKELAHIVLRRMREAKAFTLTLKITYAGFVKITRSKTLNQPLSLADILALSAQLLTQTEAGQRPIRLVGLSVSNFEGLKHHALPKRQLEFCF